jgi:hypothetical protein
LESTGTPDLPLSAERKREIFKSLVEHQDGGMSVEASRAETAKAYAVTPDQILVIEQEGLDHQWPPL